MPPTSRHTVAKNIATMLIEARVNLNDAVEKRSLEHLANANILLRRAAAQSRVLSESSHMAGTHQYASNGAIRKTLLDAAAHLDSAASRAEAVSDQIDNLFSTTPTPDAIEPSWATDTLALAYDVMAIRFLPSSKETKTNHTT